MGQQQNEKLKLSKHLDDAKKNFTTIERNYHKERKELTERTLKAEKELIKDTPLHKAASKGHTEVIRALLDYQVNKNAKNEEGQTPLHIAAREGHTWVCRILLDNEVEKDSINNAGETPLIVAVNQGQSEVCRTLLEYQVDKNCKDNIE